MRFTKKDNVYRISQLTGSQDNILGVCFSKNNSNDIQVIQWNRKDARKIQMFEDQVLKQVILGLKEVNQSLDTSYRLSKIYFLPSETTSFINLNFLSYFRVNFSPVYKTSYLNLIYFHYRPY